MYHFHRRDHCRLLCLKQKITSQVLGIQSVTCDTVVKHGLQVPTCGYFIYLKVSVVLLGEI